MAKQMSVIPFGQYRGRQISEVPTQYLLWIYATFRKLRKKLHQPLVRRGLTPRRLAEVALRNTAVGGPGSWKDCTERKSVATHEKEHKHLQNLLSNISTVNNTPLSAYGYFSAAEIMPATTLGQHSYPAQKYFLDPHSIRECNSAHK
jgi:hypothetical protein